MPLHPNSRIQHALGALVGSAVGDALGAPFEFKPGGLFGARFPTSVRGGAGEMIGGGPWAPGEFTDDTHMALALAESLVAHRGLDAADLWSRWRAWATDAKDVGLLTREALSSVSPDGAARRAHDDHGGRSAGNGSLMRNTPVALFALGSAGADGREASRARAAELAVAHSRLTHHDPTNEIGVVVHTRMIEAGIAGEDLFAACDAALDELAAGRIPAVAAARDEVARWRALLAPSWQPSPDDLPNGTVWTCLAQAVWAVRRARGFEEALRLAVDLGDDADTVGCVAGSLAGARWGIQAIPSRWSTYLHGSMRLPSGERARYDAAALQDLGRRLLGLGPVPFAAPEEFGAPARVHDELPVHAAEFEGAKTAPRDWAVVSLCRTGGAFASHAVRREVFLIDQYDATANANLDAALADAVDAVDAFLAEDPARPVLVHCHGGKSRTAFVLKAWAMRRHGWSEREAHAWLVRAWPRAHADNTAFTALLRERWPAGGGG